MTISVHPMSKGLWIALVSAMLCGPMVAQTLTGSSNSSGPSIATALDAPASVTDDIPSALTSKADFASQPLHILVGRSIFVTALTRLKRVYVSEPTIIDSFTASPTQIVVTARLPGVSSLILWDEAGRSQVYLVSSDTDATTLQNEIDDALPKDSIQVTTHGDRITLTGTTTDDASSDTAVKLATLYGKTVVNSLVVRPPHLRQVKLKVQMIEIDRSKMETFGINFLSGGNNTTATSTGQFPAVSLGTSTTTTGGSAAPSLSIGSPLNLLFFSSSLNMGLILQDLQDKQIAQILAEPTITTVSGQKASFLSGGEFPYPVVQASAGGLASVTISFRPYGVKLEFTPIVNADGTIRLSVAPEVSALDYSTAVTIAGYSIPAISTRRAETQVELRDGQSFAISGLLDHRTTDIYNKMPGFGDIPILGQLFRSKSTTHSTAELVVLVTPTLVDPLTDTTTPAVPKLPVPMLDTKKFDKTIVKPALAAAPQAGTGGKP
jgi:pilus assembly protein CpaC